MLERLWTSILNIIAQFVTPDWGALIALIPVGLTVFIALVLARTFRSLLRAPRVKRGARRIPPKTPTGIHMPGPSFAPVFAALGVGLLFLGLVFGGVILALGAIALGLTLLYWLAEGLRIYDHDVGTSTVTTLPAVVHDGPPPGVHLPGPTFRPILGAIGVFLLFVGLVFGGWLLVAGVIALIATLVGWLVDARKEYVQTVEADRTGHLQSLPAPRTPSSTLTALAVLTLGAIFLQATVFSTNPANGGNTAGGSGAPPAGSGAPPPGGSGAPSGAPAADVLLEARGIAFVESSITAPANKPFTIALDNQDQGTPHNVALKDASGAIVWQGDTFTGVATKTYSVPPQPAGKYTFLCTVHPTMTGNATLE
jgi:plastocyanin